MLPSLVREYSEASSEISWFSHGSKYPSQIYIPNTLNINIQPISAISPYLVNLCLASTISTSSRRPNPSQVDLACPPPWTPTQCKLFYETVLEWRTLRYSELTPRKAFIEKINTVAIVGLNRIRRRSSIKRNGLTRHHIVTPTTQKTSLNLN
jgi:hypothetical protein